MIRTDVLFVQDCVKTLSSPMGYNVDTLNGLNKICRKIKSAGFSVGFSCLVNLHLPRGKKPNKTDINMCSRYFKYFLKRAEPKYIIPLGSVTTKFLTGKSKFRNWVGRVIKIGNYNVIPLYHPDYAIKNKQRQREFEAQVNNVISQVTNTKTITKKQYKLFTSEKEIVERIKWLIMEKGKTIQSFDYETTHLEPHRGMPVCLSISYNQDQADVFYFFDIDHWRKYHKNLNFTREIKRAIHTWMVSGVPKVAQNAKFEFKWTVTHFNCEPNNIVGDTKQLNHLFNEDISSRLTDLAYQHTDMGGYDTAMQEFLDEGHEHWECPPEEMLVYSGGDSDCTRQIYMKQLKLLSKDNGLYWLYKNIVHPAITTLARIELRGMKIDFGGVEKVEKYLTKEIKKTRCTISKQKEVINTVIKFHEKNKKITEINFGSPPQMQHLLYKELKLPILNKSKKSGSPSTDAATLERLKDKHPIVKDIVRMRSYQYQLQDLQQIIDKRRDDDTIFSDLVQDYVVTGRLSSRNPNLQNIKLGKEGEPSYVKECFVSRFEGGVIMQTDQSQLELRLMGGEAREPKFIEAFENGVDMHQMTADEIDRPRTFAKRVNFGSGYGITEYGLARLLNIGVPEAKEILSVYWESFPTLKKWMYRNEDEARENLLVRNRVGRIRHLPEIHSSKWWLRESAERQASNSKIQSLGADINMWTMVHIDEILLNKGLKSMVVGQIHDSVLTDTHPDEINEVATIMVDVMEENTWELFTFLKIKLRADIEIGERWSDLKPYKIKEEIG